MHSNEPYDTSERGDDDNRDDFEKRLRDQLLAIVPPASIEAAGDRVWGAIRNELSRNEPSATPLNTEAKAVSPVGRKASRPLRLQSIFHFRSLFAIASSVLIVASFAQFYVVFKQQQDGIVVSTVKRSKQLLRSRELTEPNQDELSEDREIWLSISEQLSHRGDEDELVFKSEGWDSRKSR